MDMKTFIPLGITLLCVLSLSSNVNCQRQLASSGDGALVDGSGSGDLDTQGGDDGVIESGSGDGTTAMRRVLPNITPSPSVSNPDDDGGDDEDIGIISNGSGDGSGVVVSGDGPVSFPLNTACSETYTYCWCIDEEKREIPGSRAYTNEPMFASFTCEDVLLTVDPTSPAPINILTDSETENPMTTGQVFIDEETTLRVETRPPSVVETSTKFGKPITDRRDPLDGVDSDGVFRGDGNVGIVPVEPELPLFSHPGILAAIIGGGVVAILCALLLIMFVVYRMRKKDEGSYPLDPNTKPPRLHTYTRTPNKEFYA